MTEIDYTQAASKSKPETWTRDEFILDHIGDGRLTREEWDRYLVAVKCDCGEDFCHGWRAMPKTEWKREMRERARRRSS